MSPAEPTDFQDEIGSMLYDIQELDRRVTLLEGHVPVFVYSERFLDTPFVISDDRYVLVSYVVELSVVAVLLTLTDVAVDLQINGLSRGVASLGITANGLTLSLTQTVRQTLSTLASPSDEVQLVTSGSGGTATLVAQSEVIL